MRAGCGRRRDRRCRRRRVRSRRRQAAEVQQAEASKVQAIDTYYRAYGACMQGRGYTVK